MKIQILSLDIILREKKYYTAVFLLHVMARLNALLVPRTSFDFIFHCSWYPPKCRHFLTDHQRDLKSRISYLFKIHSSATEEHLIRLRSLGNHQQLHQHQQYVVAFSARIGVLNTLF